MRNMSHARGKKNFNKNQNDQKREPKREAYQFITGLEPVGDWKTPSPFICGSCKAEMYPQKTYIGQCPKCHYRILYKARPRYEVTHKAD